MDDRTAARAANADTVRVTVVSTWCDPPRHVELVLPTGTSIAGAIAACGLPGATDVSGPDAAAGADAGAVGVFSRLRPLADPVCDGDRIEIYRPLRQSAMEARRGRVRAHRTRQSTGR